MGDYLPKKLAELLLAMLAVSFIVFCALEVNVSDVAVKVLGQFSAPDQREAWLRENGYFDPFLVRYGRWLFAFVSGDWGQSTYFRDSVFHLIWPRLGATGILAGLTLLVMVPLSLLLGILAGIREGSPLDRGISIFSVLTTSIPDYASAVFLSAIFVFWLGWLPGASTMTGGFTWGEIVLPVMVLATYSTGYLARMTRASMVDVMSAPYIRTALMKGASPSRIILRHALRNALIAPVTVIMLQIPWLLSGVIVVEVFFAYKGFGTLLYEASLNSDIYLIEACAMVGVAVVVVTQLLSDLLYTWLNPRISFSSPKAAS
ncbi:ABC transporter permease [Elstera sp.]|jgi:peptide/nickel transport system permease protein|uniref:ABC transporter permease n=1 Tax=Elstera sp. TaxID=1916664 RepID=UPI0037BE93DF